MFGPETMQAAQEAIHQGGSGQVSSWIGVGAVAVSSVALWLRIVFVEGRKAKADAERVDNESEDGPVPGEGVTCRQHGEAIAGLVEFKNNTAGALRRIEGKVDQLLLK